MISEGEAQLTLTNDGSGDSFFNRLDVLHSNVSLDLTKSGFNYQTNA